MPTLSPVSKTNDSGRELLILTGTTMCLVTSLKAIVTTGLEAEASGACRAGDEKTDCFGNGETTAASATVNAIRRVIRRIRFMFFSRNAVNDE
jgi:hypothetical protein